MESSKCDPDQFIYSTQGVENGQVSNERFYPLADTQQTWKRFLPFLHCIDESYDIFGDFNSDYASNLAVIFKRCDPTERKCKSDEEISEWLDKKYIMVLENK